MCANAAVNNGTACVSDSYVWHDSFMCATWLIHVCGMTHSCARWWHLCVYSYTHKSLIWKTLVFHMSHTYELDAQAVPLYTAVFPHIRKNRVSRVFHLCLFIRVTWLIHVCDMTHSCVWHDSFMCVTWLIHGCDMTHSHVWHDSFTCVT